VRCDTDLLCIVSNHPLACILTYFSPYPHCSLSRYKDRITLSTLRPLPMFLGVTGPSFCISAQAFAPPSKRFDKYAAEKIGSRLKLNFAFFLTNYALIVGCTAFVVALMHPAMLVLMGIVYGLWYLHFLIERAGLSMVYGGVDFGEVFTTSRRAIVLTVLTVLVGVFKCLIPLLEVFAISGIAILAHASMRDPQHVETCGDFGTGDGDGSGGVATGRQYGSADSDDDEEYVMDQETTESTSKAEQSGELIRRDVV